MQETSSYAELVRRVESTGIWNGEKKFTHKFLLSPDPFVISGFELDKLNRLARSVRRCLAGMSRIFAIAADQKLCDTKGIYARVHQLLEKGAPYGLGSESPLKLPIIFKVDLVIDNDGKLWICEIDATNPRSWGYSQIGREIVSEVLPSATQMPGVIEFLVNHLVKHKIDELVFLYGDQQRFYEPEFQIVAKELAKKNISMTVINETQIEVCDSRLKNLRTGKKLPNYFVDLPPMNQNKPLIDWLITATREKRVEFIVPPKHFLSSKSLLGLLTTEHMDVYLQALLLTQIDIRDLTVVREAIPRTFIVSKKQALSLIDLQELTELKKFVLKRSISSGMKGVFMSDDRDFKSALCDAGKKDGEFVLQEEITNKPFVFRVFDDEGSLSQFDNWNLRLTAYFTPTGVADIAVTARRDKRVHGAKDSIVTGTVIS